MQETPGRIRRRSSLRIQLSGVRSRSMMPLRRKRSLNLMPLPRERIIP